MSRTDAIRQWLSVITQAIGLGGVLFEAFWEGGKNPDLLKFYGSLLLGGTGASLNWRSFLQGIRFRMEIHPPEAQVPTLVIDLGNIPLSSSRSPEAKPLPPSPSGDSSDSREPSPPSSSP